MEQVTGKDVVQEGAANEDRIVNVKIEKVNLMALDPKAQNAAVVIQKNFRRYSARKIVKGLKRERAASVIQTTFRSYKGRKSFQLMRRTIVGVPGEVNSRSSRLTSQTGESLLEQVEDESAQQMLREKVGKTDVSVPYKSETQSMATMDALVVNEKAIVKLQAGFRAMKARRVVRNIRQSSATTEDLLIMSSMKEAAASSRLLGVAKPASAASRLLTEQSDFVPEIEEEEEEEEEDVGKDEFREDEEQEEEEMTTISSPDFLSLPANVTGAFTVSGGDLPGSAGEQQLEDGIPVEKISPMAVTIEMTEHPVTADGLPVITDTKSTSSSVRADPTPEISQDLSKASKSIASVSAGSQEIITMKQGSALNVAGEKQNVMSGSKTAMEPTDQGQYQDAALMKDNPLIVTAEDETLTSGSKAALAAADGQDVLSKKGSKQDAAEEMISKKTDATSDLVGQDAVLKQGSKLVVAVDEDKKSASSSKAALVESKDDEGQARDDVLRKGSALNVTGEEEKAKSRSSGALAKAVDQETVSKQGSRLNTEEAKMAGSQLALTPSTVTDHAETSSKQGSKLNTAIGEEDKVKGSQVALDSQPPVEVAENSETTQKSLTHDELQPEIITGTMDEIKVEDEEEEEEAASSVANTVESPPETDRSASIAEEEGKEEEDEVYERDAMKEEH